MLSELKPEISNRKGTIQGKQLLLAILVSVVPLLLVGYIVNSITIEQIRADVRSDLQQVIRDKARSIEQWISERKADIHLLASTNYVRSLLTDGDLESRRAEFRTFYEKFARQYGVYRLIRVYDRNGRVVESFPTDIEFNLRSPELPLSNPDKPMVSDAFLWDGIACFVITSQVKGGSESIGRVETFTSLEALNNITDNIRLGTTGEAYIVNSACLFVTHKQPSRILVDNIANVEPIADLLKGKEQSFVGEFVDYRGIRVLGAYYYFNELGWGLVAEQDVEQAFAPAQEINQTIMIIVAISCIGVALVAYFLTTSNLRPLSTLQMTIERIREGHLDVRFPVERRDEIGITGEVFNSMLDQLQAVHELLKQRVEATDRELLTAHEELQMRHEQLKRAQERLLRSERLSTMGEVAAGLAHEINNPLTTINMLINSLGSGDMSDPQERSQALAVISEEIEKVASMIGRFMDLTHPQEMRVVPVVIEKVIDRTLALMRPKLEQASIAVEVDVPDEIPTVVGDERQLGQLLINLILNSIDAMPDGGMIKISAEPYRTDDKKQLYLRLRVSDTGTGILPQLFDKIFNPFFTTKSDGTGLGLSIVARIVESHGGKVSVMSTPGAWTTFFIDLPESKVKNEQDTDS